MSHLIHSSVGTGRKRRQPAALRPTNLSVRNRGLSSVDGLDDLDHSSSSAWPICSATRTRGWCTSIIGTRSRPLFPSPPTISRWGWPAGVPVRVLQLRNLLRRPELASRAPTPQASSPGGCFDLTECWPDQGRWRRELQRLEDGLCFLKPKARSKSPPTLNPISAAANPKSRPGDAQMTNAWNSDSGKPARLPRKAHGEIVPA